MRVYTLQHICKDEMGFDASCVAKNIEEANGFIRTRMDQGGQVLFVVEGCECRVSTLRRMVEVQRSFDRYAVVCPRLIPAGVSFEEAFDQASKLPNASIVAAPHRVAIMVRTKDFSSFGPLDESLPSIDAALAEYALRLNCFGYSSVVANKALLVAGLSAPEILGLTRIDTVRHAFGDRYPDFKDERILRENAWLDRFFPFVLTEGGRKPRILFEFSDMMPWYCGTSEYQLALLEYFWSRFSDRYEFYVRCNEEAVRFHALRERFGNVCLLDEEIPLCDIGLVAAQPLTIDQQLFLNDHCARIVFTMLDCILLRSSYLAEGDPARADIVRSGLRFSDGIISISDFSRDDYLEFFQSDADIALVPQKTIYISSDSDVSDIDEEERKNLPFDEYVLVPGNHLKHKALAEVLAAVADTDRNYVFMGLDQRLYEEGLEKAEDGSVPPLPSNVRCITGGGLSESFLSCLYENASCVVFPSQYEGFGLPITIAWKHGKKVIAYDNNLNNELYRHFDDMQENISFFQTFDQVPRLVEECLAGEAFQGKFTTTWEPAIVEVSGFVDQVLACPVDWARMDRRQWHFRLIDEAKKAGAHEIGFKRLIDDRYLKGHPVRSRVLHGVAGAARRVLRR